MKKKMAKRFGAVTLATVMGVAPVTAMAASDISGHWAEDDINTWLDAGWISGFPDGTMKPNDVVTRAQFVMMLNNILGLTTKGNASFTDVPAGSWFSDAVSIAVAAGYAAGMSDTTFAPDSTVTREQAASFVARAIGATNSGDISQYTDTAAISSWARDAVGSMSTSGYLSGMPDGSFDPQAGLTRAQAVSFLERVRKDHGVSGLPTTDTAALVIDKTATVISNETIEGDVIISSTVREGDVTFDNVHIKGDLLVQGGGANSIYLKDSTVDGKIIMDKANVRLELSGNTIVKTIEVLKVCHIDSKDFTGNVGLINFATSIPNSDGYVVIDVDADEIKLDAVVKVEINTEIGKVTITGNAAGSTVDTGKGAEIGTVVADGKVTITGDGTINKLETNADGVVVGGNVDVENETVADGVTGSGSTSGSSDDTSTSTGSGNNTSDEPWWDNNDSYDDNNNTDPEEVTPTVKNTIAVNSVIAKAAVERPDPSDYDNGEDDAEYKADYQKYEETKEHNASLQALVDDPNAVALTSTDQFTEATTLRVNDAVALNIDLTEGDIAKLDFDISANEDDDNYVEGEPIEGITATDGYNYYASWSVTDKDGKQLSETEVIAAIEKFAYVSEINDASGAPMSMLQGVYTSIDETLVFVAGNFDETVNITAQVIREDRETKDLKVMAYDTIKYTLESTSLNSYEKLKTTIESLNDVNVATQTLDAPIGDTAAYVTELQYDEKPRFGTFALSTYRAFIVPISADIVTENASLDDLKIEYTGTTPLILVPANSDIDPNVTGNTMHIEGLYIDSTSAPVAINANVYGLMAENMSADFYQEKGNEIEGSVGSSTTPYNDLKNEFYVSLSDMKDDSNDTITTSTYDLTIGDMKINVPKSSFATNSTIEDLTVEGAKEIIANAEVTDLRILKGAGLGSGNTGSYGDSNVGVGGQNQFTQAASSMQNSVWIRSAGSHVVDTAGGGNWAYADDTIYGNGEIYYENVYLEESALTSANIERVIIEKESAVLDIMTPGLAGDLSGDPTIVSEINGVDITTVNKIETAYTFSVIGAGMVKEIIVTDLKSKTPLMIQIETAGNYEAGKGDGTGNIYLDKEKLEVGYVAGLPVADDLDESIIAFGGIIKGATASEDVSDRLQIVEFLATPVMTINGTPINSDKEVSIDWALDLKDLVYSYTDTNSEDDVKVNVIVTGEDLATSFTETEYLLTAGTTVKDAKFAGIIDALAIRTDFDYDDENTKTSDYAKSLYAITGDLLGLNSKSLANAEFKTVILKVWAERTGDVEGDKSSAKNKTKPYEITVTFDAPETNPNGSENDTTLDAALIAANGMLSDKYEVVASSGAETVQDKTDVTAVELDDTTGAVKVVTLFNTTNKDSLFQKEINSGTLVSKPNYEDEELKVSNKDIYVYIANDVFNKYTEAQDEVILAEVTGALKTQGDIAAAAEKMHDALTDVEAESMLQVNELYYEYMRYSDIISGDYDTGKGMYEYGYYEDYIDKNLEDIATQQDVTDAIEVYQKAMDYLISGNVYTAATELQKYFDSELLNAPWRTDLVQANYTDESWTIFNDARLAFIALPLDDASKYKDAELTKAKNDMMDAVAQLVGELKLQAGKLNRYEAAMNEINANNTTVDYAKAMGYAAEKINEEYIYTKIYADGAVNEDVTNEATYEGTLTGVKLDDDGKQVNDAVRFYTQEIIIEGVDDKDGPDSIYKTGQLVTEEGTNIKHFMQSTSPLYYGKLDPDVVDENNFWVNLKIDEFTLGSVEGSDKITAGFLAEDWQEVLGQGTANEKNFDSYVNLVADRFTSLVDKFEDSEIGTGTPVVAPTTPAPAQDNPTNGLTSDELAIYIPVDRKDLGGNASQAEVNDNLELLDEGDVTAYYYAYVKESELRLNVPNSTTNTTDYIVDVPAQIVKFEIKFERSQEVASTDTKANWATVAGTTPGNLFDDVIIAGVTPSSTSGEVHKGIFNTSADATGDAVESIFTIRKFNTQELFNDGNFAVGNGIFSWNLLGKSELSLNPLMLISEEDEYFYTKETSEEKAVGALDADADFVPVETQTDYVGGDLNTEEFLAEGGEIGDSLVELLETSGFEIDTTPAVDTTPTV